MAGLIKKLLEEKAVFFYKTMAKSMLYDGVHPVRLELPRSFISDHGMKFGEDIVFVRCSHETNWPLRLEVKLHWDRNPRVYTCGDGWYHFVQDNGISLGDLLVFELIEFSKFVVRVHRGDCRREESNELPKRSRNVGDERMNPMVTEHGFVKILRPSHVGTRHSKLDIPAQFWRSHGCDKFDCKLFTLEGPRKDGKVRASVSRLTRQIKCSFAGREWRLFCVANKLEVGDVVSFMLTGSSCFSVSVA